MKLKNEFTNYLWFITSLAMCLLTYGQNQDLRLLEDPEFERLLLEKRKVGNLVYQNECYKIQLFNGGIDLAKKYLSEFKAEFKNKEATIVFNTPNYKVWIGNYNTRIMAERDLIIFKKKYKQLILISPKK